MSDTLTPQELRFLIEQTPRGRSSWDWIRIRGLVLDWRLENAVVVHDGTQITSASGTVTRDRMQKRDATPVEVIRTVHDALRRRYEKRSAAAKKAGITRAKRQEKKVYQAAQLLIANKLQPSHQCVICGRGLDDPESIRRGIGSECWEVVLRAMERMNREAVA